MIRELSNTHTHTHDAIGIADFQLIVDVLNPKQFCCCHCFCSCLFRISTLAFLRWAHTMAAHCFRLRHNNTDAKTCVVLFHFLHSFAFPTLHCINYIDTASSFALTTHSMWRTVGAYFVCRRCCRHRLRRQRRRQRHRRRERVWSISCKTSTTAQYECHIRWQAVRK